LKRGIFAIDSTTLKLTLDSHRLGQAPPEEGRRQDPHALNVGSRLPTFAVVEDAAHHDSTRADALCAGLKDGDVLLADRAYVDFLFLHGLAARGIFFVLREKENMDFEVLEERQHPDRRILKDQTIRLRGKLTAEKYPEPLRRVTAVVEVDGRTREMTFITNNFAWSPRTIAELYRARWAIESFSRSSSRRSSSLTSWVQRERRQVAGLDRAAGAPAAALPQARLEMGAELFTAGRGPSGRRSG
jgi:hypothetical protein